MLDRSLRALLVALITAMVLTVLWQVVTRYLFSSPSSWTEEVARFLLIWIGVAGAAWAFRTRMHVGLDLLPNKLEGNRAKYLRWFSLGIVAVFTTSVLVIGGANLVMLTWDLRQYSAVLGIPIAFVYLIIPVSGMLIIIYSLAAAVGPEELSESEGA